VRGVCLVNKENSPRYIVWSSWVSSFARANRAIAKIAIGGERSWSSLAVIKTSKAIIATEEFPSESDSFAQNISKKTNATSEFRAVSLKRRH